MALHQLPRHLICDVLHQLFDDRWPKSLQDILSLRLVNRFFNTEVTYAIFEKDVLNLHVIRPRPRDVSSTSGGVGSGIPLQRVVRGFILKSDGYSEILNTTRKALRDAALMWTVISTSTLSDDGQGNPRITAVDESNQANYDQAKQAATFFDHSADTEPADASNEPLEDCGLIPICKVYIDFLGPNRAFYSLDPTWRRKPDDCRTMQGKPGHFWTLLAAANDGTKEQFDKAIKACENRCQSEEDERQLKMHFAAALKLLAMKGRVDAAKVLLTRSGARITLNFQNLRFDGTNAMETAMEESQFDMIRLLLEYGWDLTTLPSDYIRALRATFGKLNDHLVRKELIETLLVRRSRQWRSDSIVAGLYQELFKRGDLETCHKILSLLEQPSSAQYQWQWMFGEGNHSGSETPGQFLYHTGDDDDDDSSISSDTTIQSDTQTAMYNAVDADHHEMLSFLFDKRVLLPESMSTNFTPNCRLLCLEHAIASQKDQAFTKLVQHIEDICPQKLFIYATLYGNIHAMTTLLPLIDLSTVARESDSFWNFYQHRSKLGRALRPYHDNSNPLSFLFTTVNSSSRHVKIGTFALLVAIKSLHVDAAKFLLERGCEIGTRLIFVNLTISDFQNARLYLSHDVANCEDCKEVVPRLGRRIFLFTFKRISYRDIKDMLESGADVPDSRTRAFTRPKVKSKRKRDWFKFGVKMLKGSELDKIDAKIITGIQIPWYVFERDGFDRDLTIKGLDEMEALVTKWRLPSLYMGDPDGAD